MNDFAGQIFGSVLDALLTPVERSIQDQCAPFITSLFERLDTLAVQGDPTDEELDEATTPLNNQLAYVMATELDLLQESVNNLATQYGDTQAVPLLPGQILLSMAEMAGEPMDKWFQKASMSKWQESIVKSIRNGFAQGWENHRVATQTAIERAVQTAAETGVWSAANSLTARAWVATEFRWITRGDNVVCPVCAPKNNTIYSGVSNGPPMAAHPRCRCVGVPA